MSMHLTHRLALSIIAAVMSLALLWGGGRVIMAKDAPNRITLLFTNDTLGTLEPCG